MAEEELTTIQIPRTAREALREIAEFYRRSSSAQAVWMFEQELIRIRELKATITASQAQLTLPTIEPPVEPQVQPTA